MEPLTEIRQEVDDLDRELLRVVARRMALVRQIGGAKGDRPVIDPQRERNLAEQWEHNAEHEGVAAVLATRLLREVLSHSRRVQEVDRDAPPSYCQWARRIGYQGAPGAYSELAILHRVGGDGIEANGYRTFAALLEALESGQIDAAMLPIENTIIGSIAETTALLIERPITILDEELWRVRHCLAAIPGASLETIRRVRSHSVALHQCRSHLAALGLDPEVFYDTAGAAASLSESGDPSIAALCSAEAAERNGLTILACDLEDDMHNFTRFVLVARADDARLANASRRPLFAKTSLILTTANRPGALAKCLQTFASKAINLTRIESRPRPPWEYLFLIDFEGHRDEPRVVSALNEIRRECEEVQILGSYPNRTSSPPSGQLEQVEPESSLVPRSAPEASAPLATKTEERTIVDVGGVAIGGQRFVLIAGPCAVESREQIRDAARMVSQCGGRILRGGAFKPRTSPYSFQGLGTRGVDLLQEAGREFLLPTVTEVLDVRHIDAVARVADMIQVGARNMQNFELLKELGRIGKPILLKRGMSATIDELLQAAEYILLGGNSQVVLCERGIRTFERSTRNTLDVAAVPILKQRTHLPVMVDPSHAAGRRDLVIPLALAAAAAGADGLIVEAHPRPDEALSDKEQALGPEDLLSLMTRLAPVLQAQDRAL